MTKSFIVGFKTKLDPTVKQLIYFARACGTARFAYNWALEQWIEQYKAHLADPTKPLPNECALRRQFNQLKKTEKYAWIMQVTKCAPQNAIIDLGKAFKNYFKNPKHFNRPRFHKKFVNDSFRLSNDDFKIEGSRIRIPRLGYVRMHEPLRFPNAKLLSATISRRADAWYISITCEVTDLEHLVPAENQGRVGVDLGINKMAVLSNGMTFEAPKPLKSYLEQLKRLQKKLSRSKKDSKNRAKLKVRVARLHRRIADIRKDALHKLTCYLTSHFSTIVVEDLNVRGMLKNHKLARHIADVGFYEFRRQLLYKAELRGAEVILADRFYPSSKLCRFCQHKNDKLELSDRRWVCPHCGQLIEDRDHNAAINLSCYEQNWKSLLPISGSDLPGSTSGQAPSVAANQESEPTGVRRP